MKKDKPHGQWIVLQAFRTLPPFGVTADTVWRTTEPQVSRSGIRTRLKELAYMGLVIEQQRPGFKHRFYMVTKLGWAVATGGTDGQMALRVMRNTHAELEHRRALELAPIKDKWANLIKNEMHRIALGLKTP